MAKQILLIDSDKSRADALQQYLKRQRFEVSMTTSVQEAEQRLKRLPIDIVIANPFLSFGRITADLQSHKILNPMLKIIIFSREDLLDKAMGELGSDVLAYLKTPINSKALDHALKQARSMISMEKKLKTYAQRVSDLHDAQNIYHQLFDEVPCYISVQNRDLRITAANLKFQSDFGNEVGCYCYEIYKHRTSPCLECPVVSTFEDGKSHSTEEIVTSKSGKQYNVLTQTAPIYNADGEIDQVMEMSTNITQIRQLQDHLASLGLMLGSMSHGVKGMLTALDGGIYQLESGLKNEDPERIEKAFHQIKHMADRIKRMVLEILYYAKSRQLQYRTVEVSELADTILSTVGPLAAKENILLDVDIPDNLGSVEIDPNWMQSALVNFLENAVDACRFDLVKTDHRVDFKAWSKDDDTLCFLIRDNGMGMDQETREKMFTLFFTSKGSQGTGLGMFIANRVIRHHGGNIQVESTPEKGSSFTICLPRTKPESRMIDFSTRKVDPTLP